MKEVEPAIEMGEGGRKKGHRDNKEGVSRTSMAAKGKGRWKGLVSTSGSSQVTLLMTILVE